jgi:hypothetical protein
MIFYQVLLVSRIKTLGHRSAAEILRNFLKMSLGGVRPSLLGTSATTWPLPAALDDEWR